MPTDFAARVLRWYDSHGRKDLPWQHKGDAYRVWISEIMLQQTQVQTVIPYYTRFMHRFPDVATLADAALDEVLQHWSGLGYYARARNLHRAAEIIRDEHGGQFPSNIEAVSELPGIGRSTAGAILALTHGQRHAILDGNVKRVLARHAAVEGWPGRTGIAKQLWELADARTPQERAGDYAQAMMDLGAMLCTRSKPACGTCPVNNDCIALSRGEVERFPEPKPKREKPRRTTTMVLAVADGAVYLERRPASGIWGGLWSFPEVSDVDDWCARQLAAAPVETESWDTLRHSFSHYDLDIAPVVVRIEAASSKVADYDDSTWYRPGDVPPGGIAAPVMRLIETLRNTDELRNHG